METTQLPLRERIGQYASYIGLAALLFGIIGWLWQGGITPAIIVLFGIGAAGIVTWFAMTPGEAAGLVTGRRVRFGTISALSTVALIAVVVTVYLLLQRAALTLDMTNRQDFTIDKETERILDTVNRTIRITGFYSPKAIQTREIDDQIFRLYEAYTDGKIQRVYIDPQEQPSVAEAFGMQFDGDVFVSYLTSDGLVDFNTVQPVYRETNTERDLTTAIARLAAVGRFKVYFEVGYSNIDATNESQQGLSNILGGLRNAGISVAPLNLMELAAAGQTIPKDASTVVITRSNTDLDQAAIDVLDEYLKRGGALFILTDAIFTDNPLLKQDGLFNQYLWNNYGIRALDAIVVDAIASDATQLDIRSYAVFPNEIGERLMQGEDLNTFPLFRVARAIEVNTEPPVSNGQVIATSPQSYGETDFARLAQANEFQWDAGVDVPGPFALVAWANDQNTGAKIVLAGDTDFITNGLVRAPQANAILFTDAIGWLSGYTQTVSFQPQAFTSGLPLIFVATTTLDQIAFFTVIFMPGVMLLMGLVVWVRRSRA